MGSKNLQNSNELDRLISLENVLKCLGQTCDNYLIHDIPKTPGPSDYERVEKLDFRSRSPCATISEGTKRFEYLPDPSVPGPSDY